MASASALRRRRARDVAIRKFLEEGHASPEVELEEWDEEGAPLVILFLAKLVRRLLRWVWCWAHACIVVSFGKDKSVVMKQVKESEGYDQPTDGAKVQSLEKAATDGQNALNKAARALLKQVQASHKEEDNMSNGLLHNMCRDGDHDMDFEMWFADLDESHYMSD